MINKYPAVIGIPRAMLYYRYGVLWRTFFTGLGLGVAASPPTRNTAGGSPRTEAVRASTRQAPAPYTGHRGSTSSPFRPAVPPVSQAKAVSSRKPAKL